MMVGRGTSDGEWLLLGLSRENINRLLAGEPIRLHASTHGEGIPKDWTISIVFGETELEMKKMLERAGLVAPGAKMHVDPRLE